MVFCKDKTTLSLHTHMPITDFPSAEQQKIDRRNLVFYYVRCLELSGILHQLEVRADSLCKNLAESIFCAVLGSVLGILGISFRSKVCCSFLRDSRLLIWKYLISISDQNFCSICDLPQ